MERNDCMEQWKRVVIDGIEWDYEVSRDGAVRNIKTGHLMSQRKTKVGYLQVNLSKDGKSKFPYVQRLVATAFIPNPENKPTVNHINEDKTDNRVENLEWATHKEQSRHGTLQERKAKKQYKKVKCVETGKIYESITQASVETGIANGDIVKACQGKLKTAGGFHWEYVD